MRKPNKNKMAGVNSRFGSVLESIFNGFPLKMLLRSLPVYILKQLFFSISVNSGRIFTEPRSILPVFTSISKNKLLIIKGSHSIKLTYFFCLRLQQLTSQWMLLFSRGSCKPLMSNTGLFREEILWTLTGIRT